jgi:hypothetical protein
MYPDRGQENGEACMALDATHTVGPAPRLVSDLGRLEGCGVIVDHSGLAGYDARSSLPDARHVA